MPKFNRDKAGIREELKCNGLDMFVKYGFRKTSIEDISNAACITRRTFYLYYNSKEELLLDIIKDNQKVIKERICNIIETSDTKKEDLLKIILNNLFRYFEYSPIVREIMKNISDFDSFLSNATKELLIDKMTKDNEIIFDITESLRKKGIIINKKPETIAGLFRCIILINIQKEFIGEKTFDDVIDLIIEMIEKTIVSYE